MSKYFWFVNVFVLYTNVLYRGFLIQKQSHKITGRLSRLPASVQTTGTFPCPGLDVSVNLWLRQKKSNCFNVSSPNSVDEGRGSGAVLLVDIQPGLTQQELRKGGI